MEERTSPCPPPSRLPRDPSPLALLRLPSAPELPEAGTAGEAETEAVGESAAVWVPKCYSSPEREEESPEEVFPPPRSPERLDRSSERSGVVPDSFGGETGGDSTEEGAGENPFPPEFSPEEGACVPNILAKERICSIAAGLDRIS